MKNPINLIPQDKFDDYQRCFNENGLTRIDNFLSNDFIKNLSNEVKNQKYVNAFFVEGSNREASDKDISDLPNQTQLALYEAIHTQAANGIGFHYGRSKVTSTNSDQSFSNQYLDLINNREVLDIISQLTLIPNLNKADAQLTRYRSGDFLTRHNDNVIGETRKIAYVLCLSEDWHPDWGGMLQFFNNIGTPEAPLTPIFNSVVLFDVNKAHSVTNIAKFAPIERFSVTGWFRS